MLILDRDFCRAPPMSTLRLSALLRGRSRKGPVPTDQVIGQRDTKPTGGLSLSKRKNTIHMLDPQELQPHARGELRTRPSRVGLTMLVIVNLIILAVLIYSVAQGLRN